MVDASDHLLKHRLDPVIAEVAAALKALQREDGHWVFELEADATIPAEYIMLEHFLDEIDAELEQHLAVYLRRLQGEHGGWPLFHGGDFNISASVKAYLALKLAGDDPDSTAHEARARGDPRARRGRALQRVHPLRARLVCAATVARRSGHAGRDHAAAALVPLPPEQGELLVAHGDRAAPDPDRAQAEGAEPAPRRRSRALRRNSRRRCAITR